MFWSPGHLGPDTTHIERSCDLSVPESVRTALAAIRPGTEYQAGGHNVMADWCK